MAPVEKQRSRRKKLVNLIDNENCRTLSFKKRKSTVKKKAIQLSTLCDVNVCMVCFGPDQTLETWPENRSDVVDLIIKYRGLSEKARDRGKQKYNLLGFLGDKKKKLDEKLNKTVGEQHKIKNSEELLMKNNVGGAVSSWDERLNLFSDGELLGLCGSLDSKLQELREKIRVLHTKKEKAVDVVRIVPNNLNYDPKRFNGDYFHNHQQIDVANWPREHLDSMSNNNNLWWRDNSYFGENIKAVLDENHNNNHVGMVNIYNNMLFDKFFSSGFAHATMGFKPEESLCLQGESSNANNYFQPDDHLFMFSHTSSGSLLQEVYPISKGPSPPSSDQSPY